MKSWTRVLKVNSRSVVNEEDKDERSLVFFFISIARLFISFDCLCLSILLFNSLISASILSLASFILELCAFSLNNYNVFN
jgi:hypothetical protein